MSRQWFPHYPGDYMRHTGHLSLVEDGAYRRLLDHYYSTGKPLPANAQQLHRVCRAVDEQERDAVDMVVDSFFEKKGKSLHNSRADEELEKACEISLKRSKAAKKRRPAKAPANAPAIADTATATATATTNSTPQPQPEVVGSSLPTGVSDLHKRMIEEVVNCRPEFSKLDQAELRLKIHGAGENPRLAENHAEFVSDMANSLTLPNVPTKLYGRYLQSDGLQKKNESGSFATI